MSSKLLTQQERHKELEAVKEDELEKEEETKILFWVISHTAAYQAHEHVVEVDPEDSGWNTKNISFSATLNLSTSCF